MQAIIYARTSSSGAMESRQNCNRQLVSLTEYATKNDIEVINSFEEHISGAKKGNDRIILNEAIQYAIDNDIRLVLCSELSRIGRTVWGVLETIKTCIDHHIDVYFQKENLHVLKEDGSVDGVMAIYISCLSFCAEIERESISFRLNDARKQAIARGVKMGRRTGSIKSHEAKAEEYAQALSLLRKGISIRNVAKITGKGQATIARLKKEFSI